MQSGQVSIWVPIVVGIIGVVGPIAAQLISSWREDRRLKREVEREEVRWRREQEKYRALREDEKENYVRDRMFGAYSELLTTLHKWNEIILGYVGSHRGSDDQRARDIENLLSYRDKAHDTWGRIEVIGSYEMTELCASAIAKFEYFTAKILAESSSGKDGESDVLDQHFMEIRIQIRAELGMREQF